MARLFVVPIVLALLPEGVLAFAMVAGIVWLGSVVYGFLLMLGAVLLMALPLLGDLVIEVNLAPRRVAMKMGWWGRLVYREGEPAEMRIRLLGIPYRRRMRKRPRAPKREDRRVPLERNRWMLANRADVSRALLAGLQAGNELVWQSKSIKAQVNAPTQTDVVDQIISGIAGRRMVGPLDVRVMPEGKRNAHLTYRIGLASALFVGLFVLLQGRLFGLMRSYRRAQKQAEATGAGFGSPAAAGNGRPGREPPEANRKQRRAA